MAYNNRYNPNKRNNHNGGHQGGGQGKKVEPKLHEIYNPYTFITPPNKILLLDCDEQAQLTECQDMPFEDGLSGKINVTFTAETPFCINELKDRTGKERNNVFQPFKIGNDYYVPGTSVKGMIRSVLEIISFSDIRSGVHDARYSFRTVRKKFGNEYPLMKRKPQAGFLVRINDDYLIIPISSNGIHKKDIIDFIKNVSGFSNLSEIDKRYKFVGNPIFKKDGNITMWLISGKMNNKKHEYQFDFPKHIDKSSLLTIPKETIWKDFIFIHEDENKNESWKFWKKHLLKFQTIEEVIKHVTSVAHNYKEEESQIGVIPCFYQNKGKEVTSLGFSKLYRYPYKYSVHDFFPKYDSEQGKAIDLARSIFGYVMDKSNESMKGRVQFSHAKIKNAKLMDEQSVVMGGPKASFYPFYLQQPDQSKLMNYNNPASKIAGYKRYLIQGAAQSVTSDANDDQRTKFVPLQAGATFTTSIYYHNLRPYELGALYAAITFCEDSECFHSLGFAKPLGYGKMKAEIDMSDQNTANLLKSAYRAFVLYIENKGFSLDHECIRQLKFIAKGNYQPKTIRYPRMGQEFKQIKDATPLAVSKLFPQRPKDK